MADRLTQLQDCLDDLLMQMFATLSYIQTHHPYGDIVGQPSQAPQTETTSSSKDDEKQLKSAFPATNGDSRAHHQITSNGTDGPAIKSEPLTPSPDAPDVFNNALRELAQDLVVQEQKAELLINSLPGIGSSESDQKQRMQELEAELTRMDEVRQHVEREKSAMLHDLDSLILGLRRIE